MVGMLPSEGGLLPDRGGETSGDFIALSTVRTDDNAATAAALCDPDGFGGGVLAPEDELKAEDKAAKAEALCVVPWFDPSD